MQARGRLPAGENS